MKKLIFTSIMLGLVSLNVNAEGNSGDGKIKSISTFYGGVVRVGTGVHNNPPNCQNPDPIYNTFVINTQRPGGKEQLALAISAAAQNKTVWIQGTGACDTHLDQEDVRYIGVYYDK